MNQSMERAPIMNLRKHILAAGLMLMTALTFVAPAAFAQSTVSGQLMSDLQADLGLTNAQAARHCRKPRA